MCREDTNCDLFHGLGQFGPARFFHEAHGLEETSYIFNAEVALLRLEEEVGKVEEEEDKISDKC